jgi:SAM-dependent methyltransferase
MKPLNLACGPAFVKGSDWINVDFASNSDGVIGHDLLTPLPFAAAPFDLVYSSHFLEHIPKPLVPGFLSECKRVLKPGGLIRLVLPDCEEMFSTYLALRRQGEHEKASFLIVEIVDQCVRAFPGGELGAFYEYIRSMPESRLREDWVDFVFKRNGKVIPKAAPNCIADTRGANGLPDVVSVALIRRLFNRLKRLPGSFRRRLHNVGLQLLDPAFRRQNVSFASIGEKHQWLWDYSQVKDLLESCGFASVSRETHLTSNFAHFPFDPLDILKSGHPRKGHESMYIEAFNGHKV